MDHSIFINLYHMMESLYHGLILSLTHWGPFYIMGRTALPTDFVEADLAGRWSWEDARVYINNEWTKFNFTQALLNRGGRDDLGPKIYHYNWDNRSKWNFPITNEGIGRINERMKYDVGASLAGTPQGMWDTYCFPQLQKSFGYLVHSARGGTATFTVNQFVTDGDYNKAQITSVPTVYILSRDLVRGEHPALTALGYGYRYFTEFVWNGQKMDGNFVSAGLFQMTCEVLTSSGKSGISICIHRTLPNA